MSVYSPGMSELVLAAADDLVERIAHERDAVRAVVELIWNAVDAEATTVSVELARNHADGIDAVRVVDDGHGISADEVGSTFGRIGGSWKHGSQKSKNGLRQLHGKLGEGRLRAFALGSAVKWTSISDDAAGVRQKVTISGNRQTRERFQWDHEPAPEVNTGTTVEAFNEDRRSLNALDGDDVEAVLRSHFAPVLLNDQSLRITYDRRALDPAQGVERDTTTALTFGEQGQHSAAIRIIGWKTGTHRAIYFGPDFEHFPFEEPGSQVESQFSFSAYITWDKLGAEEFAVIGLGDLAPSPVSNLWTASRTAIRDHFNSRRRERRREQVERWKDTGIYPYTAEPASEAEVAERAVFDVVSGTLGSQISSTKKDAKLTLALLRDAIRHDPERLTTIIHEVAALSDTDRDTLTRLLSETSLSAIIRSANLIASRHKFLAGLEHLLFDPIDSGKVGERDHLHRILERELWVFGEEYHLMNSERGLTQLARTHLRLAGLPEVGLTPVTRWDGSKGRVDLHLVAKFKEHDRVRHLVVELKAPGITVSQTELNQVESYANTVRTSGAFATDKASWDLILVATDYDDLADDRILEGHQDTGRFLAPGSRPGRPQVSAYLRRWRDIIDENKRRLDFVTAALEHDPSINAGMDYIRSGYPDFLPASVQRRDRQADGEIFNS